VRVRESVGNGAEGRQAFQPFVDALHELEVEFANKVTRRKRTETLTKAKADELLRDLAEARDRVGKGKDKLIAAEWVPRMMKLGLEFKIAQHGPYSAFRDLIRRARIKVDRDT